MLAGPVYDPKRTQVAQSLVDFGRYFDTIFARTRIAGAVPMRPALVVPEDMSTGGGRRARQSITLQPEVPGPAAVTCGWLDIPSRQAMLRTWGSLAGMHRQRFPNRPFDIDQAGYDMFFRQCGELLKTCGLTTAIEDSIPDMAPAGAGLAPGALAPPPVPTLAGYGAGVLGIVGLASFIIGVLVGAVSTYLRFVR